MKKHRLLYNPTFLILSLVAINIVSCVLFVRLDLTRNKKYSLSPVSKNMLGRIHEEITVNLYLSSDLSPDKIKLSKEFKNLLKEYKALSNNALTINTIIPDSREKELQAIQNGIEPFSQELTERDMVKIQRVYFGATVQIGDKKGVIPYISSHTPLEYEMTRILKDACDTVKPKVGFIQGHQEIAPPLLSQVIHELYLIAIADTVSLRQDSVLNQYKVLCVVGPKDSYSSQDIETLKQYLRQGGRMFIALNHAVGQIKNNQSNGFINRVGLEDMLEEFGLKIKYDFVVDRRCGSIVVQQELGFIPLQTRIDFPYFPIIQNFSSHLITKGLNAISLQFASSMENVSTASPYRFTPLAKSSNISGIQEVPVFFNLMKTWTTKHDFNHPNNIVAALLTNEEDNSALVVISDADFMVNNSYDLLHHDNINFAINSIEWLTDDSGLIKLRNKFIDNQVLKPIDDTTRTMLKYLNFSLPIIIILLIALYHYRSYKTKRLRRSRPKYID